MKGRVDWNQEIHDPMREGKEQGYRVKSRERVTETGNETGTETGREGWGAQGQKNRV